MAQGKPQNFGEVLAQAGSDGLNFMAANYLPQQQQQKNNAMSALAMMMKAQDAEREKQMHSLLLTKHQKDIQMAGLKMLQARKDLNRDPKQDAIDIHKANTQADFDIAAANGGLPSGFKPSGPQMPSIKDLSTMLGLAQQAKTGSGLPGDFYPSFVGGDWRIGYEPLLSSQIQSTRPSANAIWAAYNKRLEARNDALMMQEITGLAPAPIPTYGDMLIEAGYSEAEASKLMRDKGFDGQTTETDDIEDELDKAMKSLYKSMAGENWDDE